MKAFLTDRRGNFAVITALFALPLLIAVGTATDYTMMLRSRAILQDSLDAGMLAAGRLDGSLAEKEQKALGFVMAQAGRLNLTDIDVDVEETNSGGTKGLSGVATGTYKNFIGLPGLSLFDVGVNAEVREGTDSYLDLALVLDNTNSLGPEGLEAVKSAAVTFQTSVLNNTNPSRIQMAIVPFAGAVNVGPDFPMVYMDTLANSPSHAVAMESRWVAKIDPSCTPIWTDSPPDPGDGTVESFLRVPDWIRDIGSASGYAFAELFGVKPAHAGEAQVRGMPEGYSTTPGSNCNWLVNPPKINHFNLFNRISNVDWAGCVEARPDGFDTTDSLPLIANPSSLFVPYFWPDEPDDYADWVPQYTNNYMLDANADLPWNPDSWAELDGWGRTWIETKYNGSSIDLLPGGQFVTGPNRGCPEPLQPLTKNKNKVQAAINNMSLANGGGTVISEGVAWGWRVLSPSLPFAESKVSTQTKRVMVVMSDGENQMSRNPIDGSPQDSPTVSDYNAYNTIRVGRLGSTFEQYSAEIDRRTLQICQAARAEGIEIYTVLFNSESTRARDLLEACAGDAKKFFLAKDAESLGETFGGIAASVGRYRLVQ